MNRGLDIIKKQLEENGRAYTHTKGVSMLPMLKEEKDVSLLIPIGRNLRPMDVVLYARKRERTELVLHRIIKELPDGSFLIRGDNTFSDEFVPKENVIALLGGLFRQGKYIDCEKSLLYRTYSRIWTFIYPLRKFFRIDVMRGLAKVKRTALKIIKRR